MGMNDDRTMARTSSNRRSTSSPRAVLRASSWSRPAVFGFLDELLLAPRPRVLGDGLAAVDDARGAVIGDEVSTRSARAAGTE